MKVSYQILCKNEEESLKELLDLLLEHKEEQDEINVCRDITGENEGTLRVIEEYKSSINYYEREVKHTIHEQKNWLAGKATGDFLFYLDADELLVPLLVKNIHSMLNHNEEVDIYFFPRINIIEGLTEEYRKSRNWRINTNGWINYPDWQDRLFRHNVGIKYHEVPHGRLTSLGRKYATLPHNNTNMYAIRHIKTFEKQVSDNTWHDNKEREMGLRD